MFNSSLAKEMTAYIDLRISTFSVSSVYNDKRTLVLLDQYLVQTGFQGKNLTEDILSDWSKTLSGKSKTVKEKLGVVRGFGKYLNTLGYASFLPTLPKVKSDYIPYIFSDEEVTLIFHYPRPSLLYYRLTLSPASKPSTSACLTCYCNLRKFFSVIFCYKLALKIIVLNRGAEKSLFILVECCLGLLRHCPFQSRST